MPEEDNHYRNQQPEISQRRPNSQLTPDYVPETTALKRLTVQAVNVIESEGAESDKQQGGQDRSQANGARYDQKNRRHDLCCNHGDSDRPLPAFVVDVGRAEEFGDVANKLLQDPKFGASREKKKRGEPEAAGLYEDFDEYAHIQESVALIRGALIGFRSARSEIFIAQVAHQNIGSATSGRLCVRLSRSVQNK